jgi:hypothetical protein
VEVAAGMAPPHRLGVTDTGKIKAVACKIFSGEASELLISRSSAEFPTAGEDGTQFA